MRACLWGSCLGDGPKCCKFELLGLSRELSGSNRELLGQIVNFRGWNRELSGLES